jgi:hypothetical protein
MVVVVVVVVVVVSMWIWKAGGSSAAVCFLLSTHQYNGLLAADGRKHAHVAAPTCW